MSRYNGLFDLLYISQSCANIAWGFILLKLSLAHLVICIVPFCFEKKLSKWKRFDFGRLCGVVFNLISFPTALILNYNCVKFLSRFLLCVRMVGSLFHCWMLSFFFDFLIFQKIKSYSVVLNIRSFLKKEMCLVLDSPRSSSFHWPYYFEFSPSACVTLLIINAVLSKYPRIIDCGHNIKYSHKMEMDKQIQKRKWFSNVIINCKHVDNSVGYNCQLIKLDPNFQRTWIDGVDPISRGTNWWMSFAFLRLWNEKLEKNPRRPNSISSLLA